MGGWVGGWVGQSWCARPGLELRHAVSSHPESPVLHSSAQKASQQPPVSVILEPKPFALKLGSSLVCVPTKYGLNRKCLLDMGGGGVCATPNGHPLMRHPRGGAGDRPIGSSQAAPHWTWWGENQAAVLRINLRLGREGVLDGWVFSHGGGSNLLPPPPPHTHT